MPCKEEENIVKPTVNEVKIGRLHYAKREPTVAGCREKQNWTLTFTVLFTNEEKLNNQDIIRQKNYTKDRKR